MGENYMKYSYLSECLGGQESEDEEESGLRVHF